MLYIAQMSITNKVCLEAGRVWETTSFFLWDILTDDIFKWIFLNEIIWTAMKIPLKFVARGSNNNIPALVQIMAWRRAGGKPLSEPMVVRLPTHICVTRPQWVNISMPNCTDFNGGLAQPPLKLKYRWVITSHGLCRFHYLFMPETL